MLKKRERDGEELLILDLGAQFQMLNLIRAEEVRAEASASFLAVAKMFKVPHVRSRA